MGKYSEGLSKRALHVKVDKGYCLICDSFGRLTDDHVPPKGSITITKIEQRHITEVIGASEPISRGIVSRNGSKFRTICSNCNNNHIGGCDNEVAKVCKNLTKQISNYFSNTDSVINTVSCKVDALRFLKAMVGHILSATSSQECKVNPVNSPYFFPLKKFVRGDLNSISETHDVYYWFYPWPEHLSLKSGNFVNNGNAVSISLLSFFPIAFLITEKNKGIYPGNARKLNDMDTNITLDLSSLGWKLSKFPFHVLEGNQMLALADYQAVISYPIGR